MKRLLCNEKLYIRFISLYCLGLILFFLAWVTSFYFLPEGFLHGKIAAAKLVGNEAASSLILEFIRIAIVNLILSLLIVSANYVLRINGIPLGYLIPIIWMINYGLVLGTNSFLMPLEERLGPSLVVFKRSGLYELAAYTLLSVATYSLPRYEIKKIFYTNSEKIHSNNMFKLITEQKVGIIISIIVLLTANLWEAYMIINK